MLDCFQGRRHLVVVLGEFQIGLGAALQKEPKQPLSAVCVALVLVRDLNIAALPLGVCALTPQTHGGPLHAVVVEERDLLGEGPEDPGGGDGAVQTGASSSRM